ncbi:MAG: CHAP domain-containing protein, partial [Lachnospiraceae bacterium]|nr:CHAP domain-containing protein [Lachnospiraceae bacterium]
GDQVFFRNEKRICHTGIVMKVTKKSLYTIEGNTYENGKEEEQEALHGGAVVYKSYSLSDSRIAGYGRPPYDLLAEEI